MRHLAASQHACSIPPCYEHSRCSAECEKYVFLVPQTFGSEADCADLVDIGNMPYSLVRPILSKVESPAQLV